MTEDKKLEFLSKYKSLCLEYGLELTGCGECGSAWLGELDSEQLMNRKLSWIAGGCEHLGYDHVGFADNYDIEDEHRTKDTFLI